MDRQCRCGADISHEPAWKRLCFDCWKAANPHRAPKQQAAPPPDLWTYLPKLVRLCHPDKHNGSAMANEVTAWLLSLRR